MPETKAYLQGELDQKVPQKIISHFLRTDINEGEKILAVFGGTALRDIQQCHFNTGPADLFQQLGVSTQNKDCFLFRSAWQ